MVLNDFSTDIYGLCRKEGKQKGDIANDIGVSRSSLSQTLNRQVIVSSFVRLTEALGYDIRIEYIKRD